jgi:gamma-glutamylaminecyclotransferase
VTQPEAARPREYLLFVYGTLMSGEPEHARLAGARPLGPAATGPAFDLVDLGVEPALVPGGTTRVVGELYALSPAQLAPVDVHHGHPLRYRRGAITLDDGRVVEAHQLSPDQTRGRRRLRGGDWKARLAPASATEERAWSRFARDRGRSR